jgi:UDP-glucose 4-epimerase
MRILVTGGAGFIGANLVRRLLTAGDDVTVLDDLSTGYASNLAGLDPRFIKGSILDPDRLAEAIAGAESVIHLAAIPSVPRSVKDPVRSHEANATGTLRVLEAARTAGVRHVAVASSSSVYGSNPTLPKPEDTYTWPLSPYAASKLAAEAYALAYFRTYELPTIAFRFFNVYGPLQAAGHAYAAVIPTFIDAALRGQPLPVHGDGLQSRDFTFVDAVTSVLADAAHRRVASETPVNLALGTNTTLLEAISTLESLLGRELPRDHGAPRVGDVRASQANGTRLRELFPDIEIADFRQGLHRTLDWFTTLPEYAG